MPNLARSKKPAADIVKCTGEAHDPAIGGMIDNCWGCAPYWGSFPVCPVHQVKLPDTGFCKACKKYYSIKLH